MPETETTQKDPVIVVLQLTGGNDYLNTVIPYNNPLYRDNRKAVGIPDNQIMHLDAQYGIPHYMAPLKQFWDDNKLAVLHGVGWKESPRSHFRAMDIWHTCEPVKVGTEGWLGRVAREFDPNKQNVVTTVSMGPSLPRSLVVQNVPVACVAGPLERYGFLPTIQGQQRTQVLDRFASMYKPAIDHGAAGAAFVLGEKVNGGHYGEMPSLKPEHLVQGDLNPNMDFRSVYTTILDKWFGLNPAPIVNGTFEQPAFLN